MSNKTLLLVDGNSIMNRAFYAVMGRAPMTAPDGTPTGALNGFFNTLLSVCDEYKPTDICCLFDLKAPTFRHKMSADYKATRKGMPPELSQQMPIVKEMLDIMGICRMEMEGFEADDLIGTLSRMGSEAGDRVYILSGDHDDFQLIDDNVSVIMPQSGKGKPPRVLFDRALFTETYGVDPERFVYVKALMGDNSDNIKGVEKVGEKTAFKLIADYKDIEGVLANTDKLSKMLGERIASSRELLDLNMKLCTIDRNVPVPFGLEATSYTDIKDRQGMHDILAKLGLKMLTKKLGLDNMSTTIENISADDSRQGELFNEYLKDSEGLQLIDGEVPSLSGIKRPGVSFCNGKILVCKGDSKVFILSPEEAFKAFDSMDKDAVPVSFEYKEKSKILPRALPNVDSVFDTAVAGYVLNILSGNKADFARLCESAFMRPYPIEGDAAGQMTMDSLLSLGGADEYKTEAQKLILNMKASYLLEEMAAKDEVRDLLFDIEFPLVVTLDAIERNGMYVSGSRLEELHREFSEGIKELEEKIYESTGETFNIGSPKQLSEVLFDKLHLPHGKKGKTGVYSTSIDELNRIRYDHPCIDLIIEYRALSKLDSTYTLALRDRRDPDGRIRTTFTQAMTNTGRLSSTEPNLQNIPVRSTNGSRIRECFTAPQGRVLVDADYSQIELRLLAAMSGDEVMKQAFLEGEDIHKRTAMKVFGVSEEQVTSKQRAQAKTVNFSIIYGVSEFGLSTDLGISFREAGELIKEYGVQFPRITGFLDGLQKTGEKMGYVRTMFGRKRLLTELTSQNRNIRNFGLRAAMNTPIQGTAADIIKIAMNRVYRALRDELPDCLLVMQVHDELIVECSEEDSMKASKLLKREMENAVKLDVPLIADVAVGNNWLEAK
ncbi:MAG: DNA polymerase I [Clostridiales bacterium]|nr:DNA polymerase I [Clostridiales bacterium]